MKKQWLLATSTAVTLFLASFAQAEEKRASEVVKKEDKRPNIILVMSDDQGWGDVAYNGNKTVLTPHLDQMAKEAVRLDRFYAAAPVCSPTRGSVLTGRHPYRYGITWAGIGRVEPGEFTIAETLKNAGYTTGHFGKWHVGQLSKTVKQSYFIGPVDPELYSPPWENGFESCFSTESMMPTYNPYYHDCGEFFTRTGDNPYVHLMNKPVKYGDTSGERWRDHYWTGPGQIVDENLKGDDSKIVMDRALKFIEEKKTGNKPFFSMIWFHTPHTPIVAGKDMRDLYPGLSIEAQHWFGCLTAMDLQMGRLRSELKRMGIADNTIVWFCSDNGPSYIHDFNSAGPFSGKKATLREGGIRVPAIVEWPARLKGGRALSTPMVTSDFYPTLLKAAGVQTPKNQPILDGLNVLPILEGQTTDRSEPIAFQAPVKNSNDPFSKKGSLQMCLQGNRYKLSTGDAGKTWQLFDLIKDPAEKVNLANKLPNIVVEMKDYLSKWRESCSASARGEDYQ